MLQEYVGQTVVIDLRSPFVCLGTLKAVDETWLELRNADAGLRQAWHALAWACAEVSGGRVLTPEGPLSAADFAKTAELPPGLRG